MRNVLASIKTAVAILLFCAAAADGRAAEGASSHVKFCSGVFINRINDFDTKKCSAEIDFWYWVVSDAPTASLQNLELSNGKLEPVGEVISQKKDGKIYLSRRYIAQVQCALNMGDFPFDRQRIFLSFEDSELTHEQMVFVPDVANSGIDSAFRMNDWDIKSVEYSIGKHRYSSSFGYLDIPSGQGSSYSQFNVIITLDRRGSFFQKLFKYFWATIVSVIVGLFALLIRVCDLDGRFGMAVGALFANVGCSFLLSDKLPDSPSVSTAEWISYISLGFIMLFLVESIISLSIYNSGHTKFSRRLDFGTFAFSAVCYGGLWFFI